MPKQRNMLTLHPKIIKHQDTLRQENNRLKNQSCKTKIMDKDLNKKQRNATTKKSLLTASSRITLKHEESTTQNRSKANRNSVKSANSTQQTPTKTESRMYRNEILHFLCINTVSGHSKNSYQKFQFIRFSRSPR